MIDRLLEVADGERYSTLFQLKQYPPEATPAVILSYLDRFEHFRRYAAVISDRRTPVKALEVITNDPLAVPYFESLLSKHGIPGTVVVRP